MHTLPPPLNIYKELHNLVHLCYMLHTQENFLNNREHDLFFFLNLRGEARGLILEHF